MPNGRDRKCEREVERKREREHTWNLIERVL
jgi:hypothetical protein